MSFWLYKRKRIRVYDLQISTIIIKRTNSYVASVGVAELLRWCEYGSYLWWGSKLFISTNLGQGLKSWGDLHSLSRYLHQSGSNKRKHCLKFNNSLRF